LPIFDKRHENRQKTHRIQSFLKRAVDFRDITCHLDLARRCEPTNRNCFYNRSHDHIRLQLGRTYCAPLHPKAGLYKSRGRPIIPERSDPGTCVPVRASGNLAAWNRDFSTQKPRFEMTIRSRQATLEDLRLSHSSHLIVGRASMFRVTSGAKKMPPYVKIPQGGKVRNISLFSPIRIAAPLSDGDLPRDSPGNCRRTTRRTQRTRLPIGPNRDRQRCSARWIPFEILRSDAR
jgi:hypothetical protein